MILNAKVFTSSGIQKCEQCSKITWGSKLLIVSAFYESSDKILKENIKLLSKGDVNLYEFNFKSDKDKKKHYGVIAQEIEDYYFSYNSQMDRYQLICEYPLNNNGKKLYQTHIDNHIRVINVYLSLKII